MSIDAPFYSDEGSGSKNGYTVFLSNCAPFTSLPLEVVRILESRMTEQAFAEGTMLMKQGDVGDSLMVLSDGVVEINTDDHDGNRHFIARSTRGQVLGEMSLLTEEPRSANVVAMSPVRALVLPGETFHQLAKQYPSISVVLSQLVATRLGREGRDVLAGKTLGGYQIQQRLGRGGMAIIYEAFDSAHHRKVALKMMSHRLVYDEAAQDLFRREADVIESFKHQDIVQMYGRFEAFHTYFIAMEYCDGQPLDEVIKDNGALPEDEVRKILGRIGGALDYAHQQGIIHRDLKPANVMLNRDGSLKLMDFGLASPVADSDPTVSGNIVGTPRYMAPEQLGGHSVGRETDYFALGCVGYEMLTGEPLFQETTVTQLLQRHAEWQPPSLPELRPSISADVAELVGHCLTSDPRQRAPDFHKLEIWAAPIDPGLITSSSRDSGSPGSAETILE